MDTIQNAIITSARITTDDHGFLDCIIGLDYAHGSQCFGGWVLYLPKSSTHHELKSPAGHFIFRVMEIAGAKNFDELVGKTVRVCGDFEKVSGIGHIIKEDWFHPAQDFGSAAK